MTPGVWRELGLFALLALLAGAFCFAVWRLRIGSRRALEAQREIAHRVGFDTYTPQTKDRAWDDWATHHGGGL